MGNITVPNNAVVAVNNHCLANLDDNKDISVFKVCRLTGNGIINSKQERLVICAEFCNRLIVRRYVFHLSVRKGNRLKANRHAASVAVLAVGKDNTVRKRQNRERRAIENCGHTKSSFLVLQIIFYIKSTLKSIVIKKKFLHFRPREQSRIFYKKEPNLPSL